MGIGAGGKFETFQERVHTLGGIWESKYVTFIQIPLTNNSAPKFFVAAYEPAYPLSSELDRIIIYDLVNKNYMMFKQLGAGCRLNEPDFQSLKKAWYLSLLDEM